jgi:hypothetical protein
MGVEVPLPGMAAPPPGMAELSLGVAGNAGKVGVKVLSPPAACGD